MGTGLRQIPAAGPDMDLGVYNGILFQFTIQPPELYNHDLVKFDISRRVEMAVYWNNDDGTYTEETRTLPPMNEEANDDGTGTLQPEPPTQDGHMFMYDAPGITPAFAQHDQHDVVFGGNFEEFVRVRLDGVVPSGTPTNGSRASEKYPWEVYHRLERGQTALWERTSHHDDDNCIREGIPWLPVQ